MQKYDRDLFNYSSTKARRYLLKDSNDVLLDVYNGVILNKGDPWDCEHILPLKSAWHMGFNKQYRENPELALVSMRAFANDHDNLTIAGSSSNRSRGDKTLWNWSPLNLAYVPVRNAIVRELAAKYDLKLTKPQQWAMDWSDKKILIKYKHGIHLGKVRAWLVEHGFYGFLLPFR